MKNVILAIIVLFTKCKVVFTKSYYFCKLLKLLRIPPPPPRTASFFSTLYHLLRVVLRWKSLFVLLLSTNQAFSVTCDYVPPVAWTPDARGQVTCSDGKNSVKGFVNPATTPVQSMKIVVTTRQGQLSKYTFDSEDLEGKNLADFSDSNLESTIADIAIKNEIPLKFGDRLEVEEKGYVLSTSVKLYEDSESAKYQPLGSAINEADTGASIICEYKESPTLFYQANCQNKQICFGNIKCIENGREQQNSLYCSAVKTGNKFFCPTATACWIQESNLDGYADQESRILGKNIEENQEQGYSGEWYEEPDGATQ